MLFNTYIFVCVFLPVTLLTFYVVSLANRRWAAAFVMVASFVFYAHWKAAFLPILCASIFFNYTVGLAIIRRQDRGKQTRGLLAAAILFNLGAIAWFKYAGFITSIIAGGAVRSNVEDLPLGISFFTFTQIAFLIDAARGKVRERSAVNYSLFVTFFPHLIAGPVLHHADMMPQFADPKSYRLNSVNFCNGLIMFAIGLAKKVFLADQVASYSDMIFTASHPTLIESWFGVLCYTFQIYFDFSGYSDMAVGLGLMFNIRLPINFNSPYRATSIIDFWRCWHISLSTFLRDYLYIPLGGSRRGRVRRWFNLLVTMVLGGLWHGANWTFVAWGALHGVYLVLNHAWRAASARFGLARGLPVPLGRALTFLSVTVAWVFFRASDVDTAMDLLAGMAGMNGVVLPSSKMHLLQWLTPLGVSFGSLSLGGVHQMVMLALMAGIAFLFPNSQRLVLGGALMRPLRSWMESLLIGAVALSTAAAIAVGLAMSTQSSAFLYFQF